MEQLDTVKINFNPDQLFLLNVCLAFIMFGVALDLRPEHFRQLFRRPRATLTGLSSQLVLLPLLTLLLIYLLRPAASIAMGMLLVAACPGGNVSNFAVHLARGNTALSVVLTTISTLAAAFTTPFCFALLAPLTPGAGKLAAELAISPADMATSITQLVLLPLAGGMIINDRFPRLTKFLQVPVRRLSMLVFFGFVIVAIAANADNILRYLHLIFFIVLLHNSAALATGYLWARINGLPRADARAISLETGIQNSGLGLILIFNFFDGLGGMALIAAWWGVWHLVSAFTLAQLWARSPDFPPSTASTSQP